MVLLFFFINGLVVVTSLILVFLLLIYGRTKLHRLWAFCNIAVFFWGVGTTLLTRVTGQFLVAASWIIAHIGGYFIAVFYYHTISIFTERRRKGCVYPGVSRDKNHRGF